MVVGRDEWDIDYSFSFWFGFWVVGFWFEVNFVFHFGSGFD